VVITTTNAPTGSVLGLVGFCEAFLAAVSPGVRLLQSAGIDVSLRLHPAENPRRYRRLLDELGIELPFLNDRPLNAVLDEADAVVSSTSSVAFEAAGAGIPVALWVGGLPLAVREAYLIPPLAARLPAEFFNAEEFERLAIVLVEGGGLDELRTLSGLLQAYAHPFDAGAFAEELMHLA